MLYIKVALIFLAYLIPCLVVYFGTGTLFPGFHNVFPEIASGVPALSNYSACSGYPEKIKSLHLFNVLYSFLVPLMYMPFLKVESPGAIKIKHVFLGLLFSLFALLVMLVGLEFQNADGFGGFLGGFYCGSNVYALLMVSGVSAGASGLYLMMLIFVFTCLREKLTKLQPEK